jgi:RNA polymerase sigma-54 factor
MSQTTKIVQQQVLKQQQVQRLSAQHMLLVKLLEMPLTELEQSINAELDDSPALKTEQPDNINENDNLNENLNETDNSEEDDRKDELDAVLQQMVSDDELPS